MSRLMYNAKNDRILTREQMHMLPIPQAMGRFHQPYPFGDYVEQVAHSLEQTGFEVLHEEYAVQKDNQRMFGLMQIGFEGESGQSHEWLVGLRGSHDQSIPRGLTVGSRVIVCSNLCFHGDLATVKTKQTLNIDSRLPDLIREAVRELPHRIIDQDRKFEALKQFQIKPRWGDAALVEIHRRGGFTAAQLSTAVKEWDQSSFEEHDQDGFTAWRLLQAATQAVKPTGDTANHDTIRERTEIASKFIESIVH